MDKANIFKIIKLSLGSSLAIFMASLLNLEYATVAGVIVLLTVKSTKKETLEGAIGKVYGFLLCTLASYLCFSIGGYYLTSFYICIFIIVALCFIFDIRDVIAMCVVMGSHYFMNGEMSMSFILNETGIFVIGAGIGVIINMYIPSNKKQIYENQKKLQREVSEVLIDIAEIMVNGKKENRYKKDMATLNELIDNSVKHAYDNMNNNLLSDTKFFLDHMEIIKNQRDILVNLYDYVLNLNSTPTQAHIISAFIHRIGHSSFDSETAIMLLDKLDEITLSMKNGTLPVARSEFENRAILFLCLTELRKFLINRINAQELRDNYFYK